jgi:hypothetical protein
MLMRSSQKVNRSLGISGMRHRKFRVWSGGVNVRLERGTWRSRALDGRVGFEDDRSMVEEGIVKRRGGFEPMEKDELEEGGRFVMGVMTYLVRVFTGHEPLSSNS